MKNIKGIYRISAFGADLDAKALQKLNKGDELVLKRLEDSLDTYEILVCGKDGKELDMLEYGESLGIAPYMDSLLAACTGAQVDSVQVKKGKSRAKDETVLTFTAVFEYDDSLEVLEKNGKVIFLPADDIIAACAGVSGAENGGDFTDRDKDGYSLYMVMSDVVGNMYFEDFDREKNYILKATLVTKEEKYTAKARLFAAKEGEEYRLAENIALNESEQETLLTLVNHYRIFSDLPVLEGEFR